jgi:hypothetical protein
MSKLFLAGVFVGSVLLIGAGMHKTGAQRDQGEADRYKAEIDDATPITLGSEKQNSHSKVFNDATPVHRSILDDIAPYQGKQVVLHLPLHLNIATDSSLEPEEYFTWLAREADAVIRGIVASRVSGVTEDQTFLFTDYEILVNEVLRDSNGRISSGDRITVTCPGGKVLIGSVIVKTTGNGGVILPKGNDVLLFLNALQGQSDYKLTMMSAFALDDKSVRLLGGRIPDKYLSSKKLFLTTVQKAARQ